MPVHPKDNDDVLWIAELGISTLFLYREQRFRGYCILSFSAWDATHLEALSEEAYLGFMQDLRTASTAIRSALSPDHMNYELLGNTNPHLHWHIVPRYKTDPRWGRPIWEEWPRNEFKLNRHTLEEPEYALLVEQIRAALGARHPR
ncbi:MAG: HIT family protein [Anaerolineae bacterium]|nr:HIT family protein [Anaerolineae bacterium]